MHIETKKERRKVGKNEKEWSVKQFFKMIQQKKSKRRMGEKERRKKKVKEKGKEKRGK